MASSIWATEAALFADFKVWVERSGWVFYAETGGWDAVLVRPADGFQIGVEGKLSVNAKVLCQVLEHDHGYDSGGPDCWAILAPREKTVSGLSTIARRLGVVIIGASPPDNWRRSKGPVFEPELPDLNDRFSLRNDAARWSWPEHAPDTRIKLPDYVPDVQAGRPSPQALTPWKVGALKVMVVLELQGHITRADFKALGMDYRRWVQFWLTKPRGPDGAFIQTLNWIECAATPDFRRQHPTNYAQVMAARAKWLPAALIHLAERPA
jgi:hypothetical protein